MSGCVAYLDTNAVSNLVTGQGSAGSALIKAVRQRRIEIITSLAVIEELCGIACKNWGQYCDTLVYLWEVARCNQLLTHTDLMKEEIRVGRKLRAFEPFETWDKIQYVRTASRDPSYATRVAADVQQWTENYRQEEERRRSEVLYQGGPTFAGAMTDWRQADEAQIADWVTDLLRAGRQELDLSPEQTKCPDPMAIPTAWRLVAYKRARIYLNVGEGRRIDASDIYDAFHHAYAGYAQIMVSDDRRLSHTWALIPNQACSVLTVDAFINTCL